MKIVLASGEAAPFVKTGGLGDVMQALPEALSKIKNNEITLFIPYYSYLKYSGKFDADFVMSFGVDLSWRKQHVGVFKLRSKRKKLKIYFIDNEYYFSRNSIYGQPDDGERFAYFSKAVLEAMLKLDIRPDIIHCNDWQTALIPVFLHAFYHDTLGGAKTVFTIHNIEYQGKADPYFLGDTLGLPIEYNDTLLYDNCINFMKGAILKSDAVTTVSMTYSEEIKYPYYAHGLSDILREHSFKLSGIVNGIDKSNCPELDKFLTCNYSLNDVASGKKKNKKALQQSLGLRQNDDVPMIAMVTRLVKHKGLDLLCDVIEELMNWDIQLVILGTGDSEYENRLKNCADRHREKFSLNLCFDIALASQIYASCDMYLMPSKSEPCGLSQMIAMRYGSIPIVNSTGGLKDTVEPYNASEKTGVGFTFQSFTSGDMLDAVRRALTLYATDKTSWKNIISNAMRYDSSWDKPADKYMELYRKIADSIY